MRYALNPNLAAVAPPPVAEAHAWARALPEDGRALLDLAQAVPSQPPDPDLRAHLAEVLRRGDSHFYTEILGKPPLRRALAQHMAEVYGGHIATAQTAITAGCNQAFCHATTALAAPGDEVILPLPYYFNHQMWLEMQGIRPVHLPYEPARGGVPDPDSAAARITGRTRAIVLVTPNNPTGAVYPPAVIEAFFELARERGVALILDETYKDFLPEPVAPHGLFARGDWAETLIQLYSFSKAYSLTGHRVGSIVASADFLDAVVKMADCVAICPPAPGQEAALYGLTHLDEWREANRRAMAGRVGALRRAFQAEGLRYELVSAGAYFAYVRHPFAGESSTAVARRLVAEQQVLTLPGEMFGPGQDRYLRLAFANLEASAFPELVARLTASQETATSP